MDYVNSITKRPGGTPTWLKTLRMTDETNIVIETNNETIIVDTSRHSGSLIKIARKSGGEVIIP